MLFKKLFLLSALFFVFISLSYAEKGIIAYSTNNLCGDSNHDLLNSLLKEKFELANYNYYFADSFSNETIQYYSVIDMLNKNADTLIIDSVNHQSNEEIMTVWHL